MPEGIEWYRLHLNCTGRGSPTVVLEYGASGNSDAPDHASRLTNCTSSWELITSDRGTFSWDGLWEQ
jgi:hypothetical protein